VTLRHKLQEIRLELFLFSISQAIDLPIMDLLANAKERLPASRLYFLEPG
jgi:hypothetical protein